MHDIARTANLLGATALAVCDRALAGAAAAVGLGSTSAAALVVLAAASAPLSVTELGRRVGLTQSAAVRMVDALAASGLARRRPGQGRAVGVDLTGEGHQAARRLLAARQAPLAALVLELAPADQEALARVLDHLLTRLYDDVGDAELLCRLCDRAACTRDAVCPVGQAERERDS